jgi:predicted MFS family arabinose efflux permease
MTGSETVESATPPALSLGGRLIILGGSILLTLSVVSVQPVLPQIERALAITDTDKLLVKMLVSIMGVTMVLGAPLSGLLADRIDLKKLLAGFGLLYAVAGTSGFYLTNLYALLASRLLVGLAAAGVATLSIAFVNKRLEGNARARWIGYHVSVAMLSSLVAYPLVGYLGNVGWRLTFVVYLFGLILAALAIFGLGDEGNVQTTREVAHANDANPLRWFPRWFVPLALAMGTITFAPGVYLPFLVRDIGVGLPSTVAWLMLGDAVVGATMSFMFGRWQPHFPGYTTFMVCFGGSAVGLLIIALSHSMTGIVIGTLGYGVGIGWFTASLITFLSRRVTQGQQGRAVGFAKGFHYLAAPTCLLVLEPISRSFGPRGAIMALAILGFAVVAVFIALSIRPARADIDDGEAIAPAE